MKGYSGQEGFNSNTALRGNYKAQRADVELTLHLVLASLQQKIGQQK